MLKRALPTGFPMALDLRAFCGEIKNQGAEGSCTGHTFSETDEWINRRYLKRQPTLSAQYCYAQALLAQGNFPTDNGSDGLTLCNVLISKGCCELSAYPYIAGDILQPTPEQDANAKEYMLGAYHGVSDSMTAISCLGDPVPWPVEIGFTVYASFESNEVAQTGVMPIPATDEQVLGGHEVAGCGGYDIGDVPTLRPAGCPPAMLIQNSWGLGWGWNGSGFFWMPLPILDRPDTDIKIIHAGSPWK